MPDLRPNAADTTAAPMGAAPDKQLEHQLHPAVAAMVPLDNDGNPLLAKVLPAGGPLLGCPVEPAP